MLRLFLYTVLGVTVFSLSLQVATATCGDTQQSNGVITYTGNTCQATCTKTVKWKIFWLDGYERPVKLRNLVLGQVIGAFAPAAGRTSTRPPSRKSPIPRTGTN